MHREFGSMSSSPFRTTVGIILSMLPLPMQWRARRAGRFVANAFLKQGIKTPLARLANRKSPFDGLSGRGEREIWRALGKRPWNLLEIREVRQILARERLSNFLRETDGFDRLPGSPDRAARNTLEYNLKTLHTAADLDRPMPLITPLLSIARLARRDRA